MKILRQTQFYAIVLLVAISSFSCSTKNNQHESDGTETSTASTIIPVFDNVDPSTKTQLSTMLDGYFALNETLIADSLAGSKAAASSLLETADKFDKSKLTGEQMDFYFVHSSKLKSGLKDISASDDIEKARLGLGTTSEAMYALVKAFHPNDAPLYYQYCPMARNNKGGNWLSATEEVINPYMGQIMLECGRTEEKLN